MILIGVIEKTKGTVAKIQNVIFMNNVNKYKKIITPKNLHKVGIENLSIRCLENSSHDGCLKKNSV